MRALLDEYPAPRPRWARSATASTSSRSMAPVHVGHRQAAHGLYLRLPGRRVQRRAISARRSTRPRPARPRAGYAWRSPTTTWCATPAAGRTHGQQDAFTRLASTMLLSMRGSVCLYQGEELGLTEAELAFEDLGRPLRHRVLAAVQGPRRLPHADGVAEPIA